MKTNLLILKYNKIQIMKDLFLKKTLICLKSFKYLFLKLVQFNFNFIKCLIYNNSLIN